MEGQALYKVGRHVYKRIRKGNEVLDRVQYPNKKQKVAREPAQRDVEKELGYGLHDAKTIYGPRRRSYARKKIIRRKRIARAVNKSMNKKQKRLVRKIVKKTGKNKTFKDSNYMFQMVKAVNTNGTADQQAYRTFVLNGLSTGWETNDEKASQIADLFNATIRQTDITSAGGATLTEQQQIELMAHGKLYIKGSSTRMQLTSSAANPLSNIEIHYFKCKKSVKYDDLRTGLANSPYDVNDGALTTAEAIHNDGFMFKCNDRLGATKGSNAFAAYKPYTVGYNPRYDNGFLKKYFAFEKTERFEMGPSTTIVLDRYDKIKMTMNMKLVNDYALLKGVTRIVVIIARGVPYVGADTTQHIAAALPANAANTFGLTATVEHRITWRPVVDSVEQIDGDWAFDQQTTRGGIKDYSLANQARADAIYNMED